jgi:rare lipoprotein A
MGRAWGAGFGRFRRIGVLALAAGSLGASLGACSTSEPIRTLTSPLTSPVVASPAIGEPPAKGGGSFKIGRPYQQNGQVYVPAEDMSYRAEGIASWYGPDFHGRTTANGEVFDMNGISAAHPTLPMPSYLRVTNLANGRSIIVRVNDRGPYARERVVDVSIGAAKALDFYGQGLTRVRIEYVGRAPLTGSDDRMLLATLRQGSPAPVPSLARVAAVKPFELPSGTAKPAAADRSLTPGATRPPSAQSATTLRPVLVRAPVASEAAGYGLISGRGLY